MGRGLKITLVVSLRAESPDRIAYLYHKMMECNDFGRVYSFCGNNSRPEPQSRDLKSRKLGGPRLFTITMTRGQ